MNQNQFSKLQRNITMKELLQRLPCVVTKRLRKCFYGSQCTMINVSTVINYLSPLPTSTRWTSTFLACRRLLTPSTENKWHRRND